MFKLLINRKTRSLTACMLLCAMLLSACGTTPPPAEITEAAPAAETSAPAPTPTPEPTPPPFSTEVVLSELQAANKATLPDADGDFCDWIELYNPGAGPSDLSGCWLSDNERELRKWQIPALTIESGERVTIFCSKKDRTEGELHTNFKLSGDGDAIFLSSPEGELLWKQSYESCAADTSLCFEEGAVRSTRYPTPGWPNTPEGYEAFAAAADAHGALVVSEVVTYNEDYFLHAAGYYDWIELKNASDETIALSDYYVSDDADDRTKFRLPEKTLAPGEIFMVYCGEPILETAACHTPFKLSAIGEGVFLFRADGTLSDYVSLSGIPLNCSRGRLDGDVELSAEGTIYYTLNGYEPKVGRAEVYTGPIHLDGSAQIRAIAVADGKLTSEIASYTYLLGERHTLPVVCVALDPQKLNILYNNNGNMEYDSHAEYYGPEGSFASDCMITLHGAASRSAWDKKSFKIVFRDRYGGDIKFDLFGQGITEFHSLNLRGGDSVGLLTFREPLSAEFAERVAVTEPFTLDSRFCILYVNGDYWGIYTLREAYSRKYVASHTGSDEDLVSISRAPVKMKYQPELFELFNFATGHDMSDPDNYRYVADRLDMVSFAQWLLLETYFNNLDPTGNIRYAIGNRPDGKWRTMFFDLDMALTNQEASIYESLGLGHKPSQVGSVYQHLFKSAEFRQVFLQTAAGLYRNGLDHALLLEIFDRMVEELRPEMERNLDRWNENRAMYDMNVEWQRGMLTERRDESFLRFVKDYAEADDETMAELFPPRG